MTELLPSHQAAAIREGLTRLPADDVRALGRGRRVGAAGVPRGPGERHLQGALPAAADAVPARRGRLARPPRLVRRAPTSAVRSPGGGVRTPVERAPRPRQAAAAADARHDGHRLRQDRGVPLPDPRPRAAGQGATGVTGTKALLLYPMNALANDQAQRLADLITDAAVARRGDSRPLHRRAGARSAPGCRPDGLITDRTSCGADAPDILLTNYKMLDQMLLRRGGRQDLGAERAHRCSTSSSTSSTPTTAPRAPTSPCCCADSGWRSSHRPDEEWSRPLGERHARGHVGDPRRPGGPGRDGRVRSHRVRGRRVRRESVVTESRLSPDEWHGTDEAVPAAGLRRLSRAHGLGARWTQPTAKPSPGACSRRSSPTRRSGTRARCSGSSSGSTSPRALVERCRDRRAPGRPRRARAG